MNALDKKIKKITDEVLKDIKPSPEEEKGRLAEAQEVMDKIQDAVGNEATVVLAGSLGKGTQLR